MGCKLVCHSPAAHDFTPVSAFALSSVSYRSGWHAICLAALSQPSVKPYHLLLSTIQQSKNHRGWNKVLCFHLEVFKMTCLFVCLTHHISLFVFT